MWQEGEKDTFTQIDPFEVEDFDIYTEEGIEESEILNPFEQGFMIGFIGA